jgi:hypothetical protein
MAYISLTKETNFGATIACYCLWTAKYRYDNLSIEVELAGFTSVEGMNEHRQPVPGSIISYIVNLDDQVSSALDPLKIGILQFGIASQVDLSGGTLIIE